MYYEYLCKATALYATYFRPDFFLGLFLDPDYRGKIFLRNAVDFQLTSRYCISEDSNLHNLHSDNLNPWRNKFSLEPVTSVNVFEQYTSTMMNVFWDITPCITSKHIHHCYCREKNRKQDSSALHSLAVRVYAYTLYTESEQNSGKAKNLRNRICICLIERISVGNIKVRRQV
jgi:hypothetical protein